MTALDRFKFEDGDFDFPFYNKNPHIPNGVGLFYLLYGLWDFSWQYLISFILH